MLKLKYHIIVIALLFSGAMSFSQERFNTNVEDTINQIGYTIKKIPSGYEISALESSFGLFKMILYQIDEQGNLINKDSLRQYEELNIIPYKFNGHYIGCGWKDSLFGISTNQKPYLIYYNMNGDTLWTRHERNFPYHASFRNPIYLNDNTFLVSGTYFKDPSREDYFLIKYDTLGNEIWRKLYNQGNGDSKLLKTIKTPDNGFLLSGATNSYGNGAVGGSYDIYLKKVDSLGNFQWHNTWGGNGSESNIASYFTDTSIMIHGGIENVFNNNFDQHFAEILISNGQTLWDTTFAISVSGDEDSYCFLKLNNGAFISAGFYIDNDIQNPAGFLMKFNSNKQVEWIRKYKIRSNDHYFRDIIQTNDGGFALSGFVFSDGVGTTQDVWVVKVDSMGCDVPLCYLGERELGLELPILKCYPNPTNSISTVELLEDSREIQLYNSAGILQKKYEVFNGQKNFKLDLSLFPYDIYILRLLDKNGVTIGQGKVIKQ